MAVDCTYIKLNEILSIVCNFISSCCVGVILMMWPTLCIIISWYICNDFQFWTAVSCIVVANIKIIKLCHQITINYIIKNIWNSHWKVLRHKKLAIITMSIQVFLVRPSYYQILHKLIYSISGIQMDDTYYICLLLSNTIGITFDRLIWTAGR